MPKKKTHEEYVAELKEKNPTIVPIEKYNGANKNIIHKCLTCKHEWSVSPSSILQGTGCPKCAYDRLSISKEEFLNRLNVKHPDIQLFSEFTRSSHRMQFICLNCKTIFESIGNNVIENKQVCPTCYKNPNILTEKKFKDRFNKKYPSITIIGEYYDSLTSVKVRCNICNNKWMIIPRNALAACGCSKCAYDKKKISYIDFKEKLKGKKCDIECIGDYEDYMKTTLFKCNDCGYIWETIPQRITDSIYGCPRCAKKISGKEKRYSHKEFMEKFSSVTNSIELLEEYTTMTTKIQVKCKKCSNIWTTTPNRLMVGHGCPKCNKSNGENIIAVFLQDKKIPFVDQKKFENLIGLGQKPLSYDFYICTYNLLIEYQGEQHYRPVEYFGGIEQFKIQQEHDRRKREYAQNNNINLLEIRYNQDVSTVLDEYFQTHSPLKRYTKIQPLSRVKNNLKLESVETVIPA